MRDVARDCQGLMTLPASIAIGRLCPLQVARIKIADIQTCLKDGNVHSYSLADNWSTVRSEVDALLAAHDFSKTARRLEIAKASMGTDETKVELHGEMCEKFRAVLALEFTNLLLKYEYGEAEEIGIYLCRIGYGNEASVRFWEFRRNMLIEIDTESESDKPEIIDKKDAGSELDKSKMIEKKLKKIGDVLEKDRGILKTLGCVSIHSIMNMLFKEIVLELENKIESCGGIIEICGFYEVLDAFVVRFETIFESAVSSGTLSLAPSSGVNWKASIASLFNKFQSNHPNLEKMYLDSVMNVELPETIMIASQTRKRFLLFSSLLKSESLIEEYLVSTIDAAIKNISNNFTNSIKVNFNQLKKSIKFTKDLGLFYSQNSKIDFKSIHKSVELIKESQKKLLASVVQPLDGHLKALPTQAQTDITLSSGQGVVPNPTIAFIGEFILKLPQVFEAFALDQDLLYYVGSLPFSHSQSDVTSIISLDEAAHLWIISAARLVESKLIISISSITALSNSAQVQLLTDLLYFTNVISAIDLEPGPVMADWIYALGLDSKLLQSEINSDSIHSIEVLKTVKQIIK